MTFSLELTKYCHFKRFIYYFVSEFIITLQPKCYISACYKTHMYSSGNNRYFKVLHNKWTTNLTFLYFQLELTYLNWIRWQIWVIFHGNYLNILIIVPKISMFLGPHFIETQESTHNRILWNFKVRHFIIQISMSKPLHGSLKYR